MAGYKKKDTPHPSPQYLLTTGEKKNLTRRQGQNRVLTVFVITRQHMDRSQSSAWWDSTLWGFTHQGCPWLLHGTHSCVNTSHFLYQRSFLTQQRPQSFCHFTIGKRSKHPMSPNFQDGGGGSRTTSHRDSRGAQLPHCLRHLLRTQRNSATETYKLQTPTCVHPCQPGSSSSVDPTGSSNSLLNQHTIDVTWDGGGQYTVSKHAKQVIMPHNLAKCRVSKSLWSSRNYKWLEKIGVEAEHHHWGREQPNSHN